MTTEETVQRIRSFHVDYALLQWIVCVFLGGAIDAVVIKSFVSYCFQVLKFLEENNIMIFQSSDATLWTTLFGIVLFLCPIMFSILFTRWHPEKRIVPPFYLQLIAFGLLLFFVYNILERNNMTAMYLLFVYVMVGRVTQDPLVTSILGKNSVSNDIARYSLKVQSNLTHVQEIVMAKSIREKIGLKRVIKQEGKPLRMGTSRRYPIQMMLEFGDGGKPDETIVNIAVYEEKAYSIQKTDKAVEFAKEKKAYIKSVFHRSSVRVAEDSPKFADSLMDYVLDEKQGAMVRLQEMPTERRVKAIVAAVLIVVGIGLSLLGVYLETGILIVVTGVGLAIETFARRP